MYQPKLFCMASRKVRSSSCKVLDVVVNKINSGEFISKGNFRGAKMLILARISAEIEIATTGEPYKIQPKASGDFQI